MGTGQPHSSVAEALRIAVATSTGASVHVWCRDVHERGTKRRGGYSDDQWVYAVVGIITASQVPVTRNLVHKSGERTGTTTGALLSTCYNFFSQIRLATGIYGFEAKCQVALDHIGSGGGDSGAPVFARLVDGGSYYALAFTSPVADRSI